jgi:hypothetical protein
LLDVIIPEVNALAQTAKFYREGDRDYVSISFVGEKDTVIRRVTPEHMARFRNEWNAYCDGIPLKQRDGTPLTDIPNLSDDLAQKYISQNVHTADELAVLSDAQCQSLGHGTLTFRAAAQAMLASRKAAQMEAASKRISEAAKSVSAMPAEAEAKFASKEDVEAVKGEIGDIKAMMGQMMEMMQKRGPGRPKKEASED